MADLTITINGQHLVKLSTAGLDLVSVRIFGNRRMDEFGVIDADGASYLRDQTPSTPTWLSEYPFRAGDRVGVRFAAHDADVPDGQPAPATARLDFTPDSGTRAAWIKRPLLRSGYRLALETSSGEHCEATTSLDDESLSVVCTWHKSEPALCRVWVSTRPLRDDDDTGPTGNTRLELGVNTTVSLVLHAAG